MSRFLLQSCLAAIFGGLLFCSSPASASGEGTCQAKGVVTAIKKKQPGQILVQIQGPVKHDGDSSGCALEDGHEIEASFVGAVTVGSLVNVNGDCSNGMTSRGPVTRCIYTAVLSAVNSALKKKN